jgi:hypothetical protein
MAVSAGYLTKIRRAVRRNTGTDVDAELTDIIEECRLDLQTLGISQTKAESETDSLILGAVRCFARWKFGLSNEDAEANRDDYMMLRDELRRKRDYMSYAITFVCKDGIVPVADAEITFNGETKETDAAGTAVFYYVNAGVNQEYTVTATGYTTQVVDLDITANATVNIALV